MAEQPTPEQLAEARLLQATSQRELAKDAQLKAVAAWDKKMTRAFKGIISRPLRHSLLQQAYRQEERQG